MRERSTSAIGTEAPMFCRNCGSQISEGSSFCTQCGARVDAAPANVRVDVTRSSDKPVWECRGGAVPQAILAMILLAMGILCGAASFLDPVARVLNSLARTVDQLIPGDATALGHSLAWIALPVLSLLSGLAMLYLVMCSYLRVYEDRLECLTSKGRLTFRRSDMTGFGRKIGMVSIQSSGKTYVVLVPNATEACQALQWFMGQQA